MVALHDANADFNSGMEPELSKIKGFWQLCRGGSVKPNQDLAGERSNIAFPLRQPQQCRFLEIQVAAYVT